MVSSNVKAIRDDFPSTGITSAWLEAVEPWVSNGKLKVLEWLSVDPLAILRSENVICSVHQYVGPVEVANFSRTELIGEPGLRLL